MDDDGLDFDFEDLPNTLSEYPIIPTSSHSSQLDQDSSSNNPPSPPIHPLQEL